MPLKLPELTPEAETSLKGFDFEQYRLRSYTHWHLFLNKNQYHLGRAYAWLKTHQDLMPFSSLRPVELVELQRIETDLREACRLAWGRPDLINMEWLGNEYGTHRGHGHMHFIPRYKDTPFFDGNAFPDPQFGARSPYAKLALSEEKLQLITTTLRSYIPRS